MQTSEEISITFQVDNDGNADDTIEIRITNANGEQLGFVLQSGDFLAARDVQSGGVSEQLEFIIAPSDAESEIRNTIVIEASSTLDDSKDIVDFDLIVAAEEEAGKLGCWPLGSKHGRPCALRSNWRRRLFVIFLLVIIGRVSKRSSKKKIETEAPVEAPIELEDEDELDFDLDFEDDEFLSDDLDSMLDDL